MPAVALYFRDPDGHSLELITMLPDAPQPQVGVVSVEAWEQLQSEHFVSAEESCKGSGKLSAVG